MKRRALITGASSGIGAATARLLAIHGYDLVLTARRQERLEKLAAELMPAVKVDIHSFDIQDASSVEKFAKSADLSVDVLVNNAGLAKGVDKMQNAALSDWDTMIDTNVKGLLYLTRAVLPKMIEQGRGHIVNLGSVAGRWVYPGGGVYCATKFAVRAISEGLRMDLMGKPIRVTNIEPGMVESEFSEVRFEDREKAKKVYAGMQPLSPEDIADTILWCIERPAHINIQELVIFPTDQVSPSLVHRRD
jgi:3-hydroxy acid dehydrogenase/malonic semialdehyde reductase